MAIKFSLGLILFSFLFLVVLITSAGADIIYLKNGRSLEGLVKSENENSIEVEVGFGTIMINKGEIKRLDKASFTAPQQVLQGQEQELPGETLSIGINSMIELDSKTKEEIFDLRRRYVLQYPELLSKLVKDYRPSEAVFGQVIDAKPWWGALGQSYYGPGNLSIEGPAEESRFLANPYLLVGLDYGVALVVDDNSLTPIPMFPQPINLLWKKDGSFAKVLYDVKSGWLALKRYHYGGVMEKRQISMVGYNARDLGLDYLYVDLSKSSNILASGAAAKAVLIRHYIHCGGSCGYPGGCNNMSPATPELDLQLSNLPAKAYLKLWKKQPKAVEEPADVVFVIDIL